MISTISRGLLLGALACRGLATTVTGSSFSTATHVHCSAEYAATGTAPISVPTSGTTRVTSSMSTRTTTTVPSQYTRITEEPVTTTIRTSVSLSIVFATVTSPTYTSWVGQKTTIATATFPVTECTNGVTPTTVTKYTGTYTPVAGQPTTSPRSHITKVACTTDVTSFITLFPTVSTGVGTVVTTPTVVVSDITASSVSTFVYATMTSYATTLIKTTVTYTPAAYTTTVSTACEPTKTVTHDIRCAPTNIIGDINGMGILSGRYAANTSVIYTREEDYAGDAGLCCQACLDNEGCGASMAGLSGACGLYYTSDQFAEPQCGSFIFSFTASPNAIPGQSLLVQSGCGTVELEK